MKSRLLTSDEGDRFYALCDSYKDGIDSFVTQYLIVRRRPEKTPGKEQFENPKSHLSKIRTGHRPLARPTVNICAKILGMSEKEIWACIEKAGITGSLSANTSPWVNDEEVLKKYRIILHHYYQTQKEEEIFWIYTRMNFTETFSGYLYAPLVLAGIDGKGKYEAYGYILHDMLAVVLKSIKARNNTESVHLFTDFHRDDPAPEGHFGIIQNVDWNGNLGFGACILSDRLFIGTEGPGRQTDAICGRLNKHWKVLGGHRCDRIRHLYKQKPYKRPSGAWQTLSKAFAPSTDAQ